MSSEVFLRRFSESRWEKQEKMTEKRILYENVPFIDGQLQAVGGGNTESTSCEALDTVIGKWEKARGFGRLISSMDCPCFCLVAF